MAGEGSLRGFVREENAFQEKEPHFPYAYSAQYEPSLEVINSMFSCDSKHPIPTTQPGSGYLTMFLINFVHPTFSQPFFLYSHIYKIGEKQTS